MRPALLLAALLSSPATTFAQSSPPTPDHPVATSAPAAAEADVASLDAILGALYAVISGPVGQARDWNRLRSLFIPSARMMPIGERADGSVGIRLLAVNDYVALSGPLLVERGFRERELARRTERFGHLAQVFSTYEGTVAAGGAPIRGINSIQLMHDGRRWWIVSLAWAPETASQPLPQAYLPADADTR